MQNRKRALFGLAHEEAGDALDQATGKLDSQERPFTSPGGGGGDAVPSWLKSNTSEARETGAKGRPATTGANKPPLYLPKSDRFDEDDLNDRDPGAFKKDLQVTPPIGLEFRGEDDILGNQEITTFGRRPRTD